MEQDGLEYVVGGRGGHTVEDVGGNDGDDGAGVTVMMT